MVIYGGRNHRLFGLRGGKTAFSDIHILNLNYLVWCQVKANSGPSLERYLFNSFLWDNKLVVFGGLNDRNFAGCNVNRLELLEEEAKFLKGYKEENCTYEGYMKKMERKRKKNEKKTDYNEILEMVNKKQKSELNLIQSQSFTHRPNKNVQYGEKSSQDAAPGTFRGFAAVPDPFLDLINRRINSKNKSIAKF